METVVWESKNDAEMYRKLVERNRVFEFLIGLKPGFDIIRQNILAKDEVTLSQAYAIISSEESRRQVQLQSPPIEHFAHARIKPKGPTEIKEQVCEYCKKPRHTKDTCWKFHPDLLPDLSKNKNNFKKGS